MRQFKEDNASFVRNVQKLKLNGKSGSEQHLGHSPRQKSTAGEQLKAQTSQGAAPAQPEAGSKKEGSKDEPLTFTHRGFPHPLHGKDLAQSIWLVGNNARNDVPSQFHLQEPLLISSTSQHLPTSTWNLCQDTSCKAT